MSGWVQIAPRPGRRPDPKVGVTIALRRKAGDPHSLGLTFRAGLVAVLGWKAKEHATVSRNEDGTKLLIGRAPKGEGTFVIHGASRASCLYVNFSVAPAAACAGRAAEDAPHELTPEGVVVSVPVWATVAMGLPAPVIAAPPSAPQPQLRSTPAAFPPAPKQPRRGQTEFPGIETADLDEARTMMRSGKVGAAGLAEYFGWSDETAVKVAAALRDDLAAEARRKVA